LDCIATLLGARLGHVFFYDWEYYRNHYLKYFTFSLFSNFEFTGYQGLASHGAISIIVAMYFTAKYS
jgi:prolipoprotein diacylglyceryltransferase